MRSLIVHIVCLAFVSAFIISLAQFAHASPSDRPNVIIIMTDDQGRGDFSCMKNPVLKTPNIDKLAEGAVWMTRFYVSPVCTPTRACLMTGRYNYRTRAIDTFIGRAMMEPKEVTVAEVLRDAGYATGIFGKWHLGDCYPMRPMDQGFQETLVHRGGGIGQPGDPPDGESKYTDPVLFHNGRQLQTKGYCTDVYFDFAMNWIERQHDQGRNFFVYIPTNAPHGPFHDVPEELYQEYKKLDLQSVMLQKHDSKGYRDNADTVARIFAMIANVDENVGRLQKKLQDLNILENTIVIFLTDNGPNSLRYVGDIRGMKSNVHEGGIRTVFWAHWPAQLKAGQKCDVAAAHVDVMPTVLDACCVAPPADLKFDGRSILPLLKGKEIDWPERTLFIQSHRGNIPVLYHHFAAIGQQYKLVNPSGFGREQLPHPPKWELYNLLADPGEHSNLADEHPEIVQNLKKKYEQWFEDVSSTRPDNYAPPRIYIGTPHENPVTLTRQDWRHESGTPWALDSNGHWELHVAREGLYDFNLRFKQTGAQTRAELRIGEQTHTVTVDPFDGGCSFKDIAIKPGDVTLVTTLTIGDKTQGAWQVDVFRQ